MPGGAAWRPGGWLEVGQRRRRDVVRRAGSVAGRISCLPARHKEPVGDRGQGKVDTRVRGGPVVELADVHNPAVAGEPTASPPRNALSASSRPPGRILGTSSTLLRATPDELAANSGQCLQY